MKINLVRIAIVSILLLSCTNKKFINRYNLAFLVNQTKDQEEKKAAIFDAIARDSQEEVQYILRHNAAAEVQALLRSHNTENRTPLQEAIQRKNKAIIQHLVDAGATLAVQPGNLTTPQQGNDAPIAILQELLEEARQAEDLPFLLCLAKSKGELNVAKTLEELATNSASREEIFLQALEGARHKNEVGTIDRILVKLEKEILGKVLLRAVEKDYHQLIPFLLTPENQEKLSNESLKEVFERAVGQGNIAIVELLTKRWQEQLKVTIYAKLQYAAKTQQQALLNALYKPLDPDKQHYFFHKAVEETNSALVGFMLAQSGKIKQDKLNKAFENACQRDQGVIVQHCLRSKYKQQLEAKIPSCFLQACSRGCTTVVQALCPQLDSDTIATGFEPAIDYRQAAVIGCLLDNLKNSLSQDKLPSFLGKALNNGNEGVIATFLKKVSDEVVQKLWKQAISKRSYPVIRALLARPEVRISQENIKTAFTQAANQRGELLTLLFNEASDRLSTTLIVAELDSAVKKNNYGTITAILQCLEKEKLVDTLLKAIEQNKPNLLPSLLDALNKKNIGNREVEKITQFFISAVAQGNTSHVRLVLKEVQAQLTEQAIAQALLHTTHPEMTSLLYEQLSPFVLRKIFVQAGADNNRALVGCLLAHRRANYQSLETTLKENIPECFEQACQRGHADTVGCLLKKAPDALPHDTLSKALENALKAEIAPVITTIVTQISQSVLQQLWQQWIEEEQHCQIVKALLSYTKASVKIGQKTIDAAFTNACKQGEHHALLQVLLNLNQVQQKVIVKGLVTTSMGGHVQSTAHILKNIVPAMFGNVLVAAAEQDAEQDQAAIIRLLLTQQYQPLKDCTIANALQQAIELDTNKVFNTLVNHLSKDVLCKIFVKAVKDSKATFVKSLLALKSTKLEDVQQQYFDVDQQLEQGDSNRLLTSALVYVLQKGNKELQATFITHVKKGVVNEVWKYGVDKKEASVVKPLLAYERSRTIIGSQAIQQTTEEVTAQEKHPLLGVLLNKAKLGNKFIIKMFNTALDQGKLDKLTNILKEIDEKNLIEVFYYALENQEKVLLPFLITKAKASNAGKEAIVEALKNAVNQGNEASVILLLRQAKDMLEDTTLATALLQAPDAPNRESVNQALCVSLSPSVLGEIFENAVKEDNATLVNRILDGGSDKLDKAKLQQTFKYACQQSLCIVALFLKKEAVKATLQAVIPYCFEQAYQKNQAALAGCLLANTQDSMPEDVLKKAIVQTVEKKQKEVVTTLLDRFSPENVNKVWEKEIEEENKPLIKTLLAHSTAKLKLGQATIDAAFINTCTKKQGAALLPVFLDPKNVENNVIAEGLAVATNKGYFTSVDTILDNLEKETLAYVLSEAAKQEQELLLSLILSRVKKANIHDKAILDAFQRTVVHNNGSFVAMFLKNVSEKLDDQVIKNAWKKALGHGSASVVTSLLNDKNAVDHLQTIPLKELIEAMLTPQSGYTALELMALWEKLVEHGILEGKGESCSSLTSLLHAVTYFGRQAGLEKLLRNPIIDVNTKDRNGFTPFWLALLWTKDTDVFKYLLSKGADATIEDFKGARATIKEPIEKLLWSTLKTEDEELLKLLIDNGADMSLEDKRGYSLPCVASEEGRKKILEILSKARLLEKYNKAGETPLIESFKLGSKVAKRLLEAGANVHTPLRDKDGWTPLHVAAENDYQAVVRLLLEKGANVDAPREDGWTPLHVAVYKNHQAVVRLLLEKGANVDAPRKDGWTPLHVAVYKNHQAVVRLLLEKSANVDAPSKDGWTLLHVAIYKNHQAVVRLLLEKGANVDAPRKDGWTPLHVALYKNHQAVVRLLLEKGANVDAPRKDGWTPLHVAAENDYQAVVRLLLEKGANVDAPRKDGWTPLHVAAENDYQAVVRLLLGKGANVDALTAHAKTPVELAVAQSHVEVAKVLLAHHDQEEMLRYIAAKVGNEAVLRSFLEKRCQVDEKNKDGEALLHLASANGHEAVVRLLLKRLAEVDIENKDRWTPLHLAAANGHKEVVRLLFKRFPKVNAKDQDGKTPLHLAAENGHKEVVSLLVKKHADVDMRTTHAKTAVELAAEKGHTEVVKVFVDDEKNKKTLLHIAAKLGDEAYLRSLLKERKKVNKINEARETPLHRAKGENIAKCLFDHGADLCATDHKNRMPLHTAACEGRIGVVKFLIGKVNKGVKVDIGDFCRRSPLHLAVLNGQFEVVEYLLSKRVASNTTDDQERTPLHYAVLRGNDRIAEHLIDEGAMVNIQDKKGKTPLHYAVSRGNYRIAEYLIDEGVKVDIVNIKDKRGQTPLYKIDEEKNGLKLAILLIRNGAKVNDEDTSGITPLDMAIEDRNQTLVNYLIKKGADLRKVTPKNKKQLAAYLLSQDSRKNGEFDPASQLIMQHFLKSGNNDDDGSDDDGSDDDSSDDDGGSDDDDGSDASSMSYDEDFINSDAAY